MYEHLIIDDKEENQREEKKRYTSTLSWLTLEISVPNQRQKNEEINKVVIKVKGRGQFRWSNNFFI